MSLIEIRTATPDETRFNMYVAQDSEQDLYDVVALIQNIWGDSDSIVAQPVQQGGSLGDGSLRLTIVRQSGVAVITRVSTGRKTFSVEVDISRSSGKPLRSMTVSLPLSHWKYVLENNMLEHLVEFLENTKRCGMSESCMSELMVYFYDAVAGNKLPVVKFTNSLSFDGQTDYCMECESYDEPGKIEKVIGALGGMCHEDISLCCAGYVYAYPAIANGLTVSICLNNGVEVTDVKPCKQTFAFKDVSNENYTIKSYNMPVSYWYALVTESRVPEFVETVESAIQEGKTVNWVNTHLQELADGLWN